MELRKALAFLLAWCLQEQNHFEAAREQYETYLHGQTEAPLAATARHALAQINEELHVKAAQ